MHVFRGLGRIALLVAALAALALTFTATTAIGQTDDQPACSDNIDNDSDNAVDGADAGCGGGDDTDETDSPYSGIKIVTVPLPLVTLQGTVDSKGTVVVSLLEVQALRGSVIEARCSGKACPFKSNRTVMITGKVRLKKLERKLRAPMTLTLRIRRNNQLGKYVRYQLRRNKAPLRKDACLDQVTEKVIPCYVG